MTTEQGVVSPAKRPLGKTGIDIAPLVFGGNVFGWTVDQDMSFALLDRFLDAGFGAVDTADVYSAWVPGNVGGESETILGNWLRADPSRRSRMTIITKVGAQVSPKKRGLSANYVTASVEESLRRLQTDYIDVYFSHYYDPETPPEETLRVYERLIQDGKVRAIGASNHNADQLHAALAVSAATGLPRYDVFQPEYNLYDRSGFENKFRDLCLEEEIGVITYYSLASGFLSGKYRSMDDLGKSARGGAVAKYLDARGMRILDALDDVAKIHDATPAEIALAWLIGRKGVTAPIASATTLAQLESLIRATRLSLSGADVSVLNSASEPI
ncbi:aldo/keto reductase [Govanella unica]|uniref:Aldo/keto reductase n=1 Tax=Govanella unica TaxID=2975056 RepID=A0A9X3TYB8_9PROT|nr:aldo/keto reductase [Govania unica]MDA5193932.1 aldo/keto reductase [Govania unica]